jgi:hypothetical protein
MNYDKIVVIEIAGWEPISPPPLHKFDTAFIRFRRIADKLPRRSRADNVIGGVLAVPKGSVLAARAQRQLL